MKREIFVSSKNKFNEKQTDVLKLKREINRKSN